MRAPYFKIFLQNAQAVEQMADPFIIVSCALLVPLAVIITYYDVRYRRIPNAFVLATLTSGLALNAMGGGLRGVETSVEGCVLAFILMFMLHVFGAMGAGDVKLFAAIGSVVGSALVLPTFAVVVLTGGALAVAQMIRSGLVRETLWRVAQIFVGLLP